MSLLLLFLVSLKAHAQVMTFRGHNTYFSLRLQLTDPTGEGWFLPARAELDEFNFSYTPTGTTHSPRELFYVDVFGRTPWQIGADDIEMLKFGRGVGTHDSGVGGYFVLFKLKPAVRRHIKGYRYVALGLGGYGQVRSPHHVLLLNDEADDALENFKPSLWHRLYLGDRLFLDSILECEGRLESSAESTRAPSLRPTS